MLNIPILGVAWRTLMNTQYTNQFISPVNASEMMVFYEASPAVKNLQILGQDSYKLNETRVKNHLIAGSLTGAKPTELESLNDFNYLIDFFDILRQVTTLDTNSSIEKEELEKISIIPDKYERVTMFMELCFAFNIFEGDLIVPLASQMAQQLSVYKPENVTIFSGLTAFHTFITDRPDVGKQVKDLLNTTIHSKTFGDVISANTSPRSDIRVRNTVLNDIANSFESHIDTSHIEIVLPFGNYVVFANDPINIVYHLKKTDNLAYVEYLFQDQRDIIVNDYEYYSIGLNVSPNFLGKQTVYVSATYDIDNKTIIYTDTLSVNVVTDARLVEFKVNPYVAHIFKGQMYYPQMTAVYETFLSNVSSGSDRVGIRIQDPSVVVYDESLNCFIGLKEGTTIAEITYEHLKDTLYFNVMDVYLSDTEVSNELIHPDESTYSSFDAVVYPNPVDHEFTLVVNSADDEKIVVSIYNMFGQKIDERPLIGRKTTFNSSNYPQGIYFVRIATESGQIVTKKIIKR
jgi:hypothetical protein